MTSPPLVLTIDNGAVRVLTMNRPAARNALSRDLIRATYAALTEADADESVRAVVLTGSDPAFCAGVDLKEAQRDGLKYFAPPARWRRDGPAAVDDRRGGRRGPR